MNWDILDPYEDMKKFRHEMERAFQEAFRPRQSKEFLRQPLADVKETDKEVIAKLELPGIEKKDIDLNITEDMFEVKAERKEEAEEKKKGFYRQERKYSGYHRAFSLPCKVKPDKVDANFKNGVLEVIMPKAEVTEV